MNSNKKRICIKTSILFFLVLFCFTAGKDISVHATSANPVSVRLPIAQSFISENKQIPNVDKNFVYELTPIEKSNPMPSGSVENKYTVTVKGNKIVQTSKIIYTHAGIFNYTVKALKSNDTKGYTNANSTYTIAVCVRNKPNGQLEKPELIIQNQAGRKAESLAFTYVLAPPNDNSDGDSSDGDNSGGGGGNANTGDTNHTVVWFMLGTLSILALIFLIIKRKKDSEQLEE